MTPSPFELPVKASEAAALADIAFQLLEGRKLQDDLRNRLATRAEGMNLVSIKPYWGSLQTDPVHASAYYLAIDAMPAAAEAAPVPLLLRFALASAPASALFPKATLIGRMRPGGGREVVVNAAAFGPSDAAAIDTFVTKVDRTLLARPQGVSPSITVVAAEPETEAPAAFEGFRAVQKSTGLNLASIAAKPGRAARTLAAAEWSAIRAGWRAGYNVEADEIELGRGDLDAAVAERVAFTRFRAVIPESPLAAAGEDEDETGVLGRRVEVGDTAFQFEPGELHALAARYSGALAAAGKLSAEIRKQRGAAGLGRVFDFELVLPEGADARAAFYCLQSLRSKGAPANAVTLPHSLESVEEASRIAAVARHFNATIGFDARQARILAPVSAWAGSRWNCRVRGDITAARVLEVAALVRG